MDKENIYLMLDDFCIPFESYDSNQMTPLAGSQALTMSPPGNSPKIASFFPSPSYESRFCDQIYTEGMDGYSLIYGQSPAKDRDPNNDPLMTPILAPAKRRVEAVAPKFTKKSKRQPMVLKPFASFDSLEISVKSLNKLSGKDQVPLAGSFL